MALLLTRLHRHVRRMPGRLSTHFILPIPSMNSSFLTARRALSALAILLTAASAHAEFQQSTTPGSACKLDGVPSSKLLKDIESRMSGTTNGNEINARNIVCPIARTQLTDTNIVVSVEGKVKPGKTINCTIESRDGTGEIIASKNFSRTGTGFVGDSETFFTASQTFFTPQLPLDAYLSMQCSLPAAQGATVFGIKTLEELP
jgi:hypothetical protein